MSPTPQFASAPGKPIRALGGIGFLLGIVLAWLKALRWSHGIVTAEVFGYAVAGVLIPFLIAYAIAGRRTVRDWNRVGVWFFALSLGFYFISHKS